MAEKTKKKGSVGSIIVTVILVIAILFAIVCSYSAFTTKSGSGVPNIFGFEPFAVQSDSMAPFFYKGDLVIDKAIKPGTTIEVGDIITFWTVINGYKVLNTHRVTDIIDYGDHYYFETKGDAATENDYLGVHQGDVVGKYVTHIPKLGSVLDFLQTSKGFFCCIVVPVALFFIYQLISFFKTLNLYRTEKIKMQLQEEMAAMNAAKKEEEPSEEKKE